MNCKEIKMKNMFDDHVCVEINLRKDDRLLCGCIYRSQTDEKAETIENTTKGCRLIAEGEQCNNSHLFICGDFNYPSIDWENEYVDEKSSIITPFIETIQKCYLHQHIFQPTRFRDGDEPSLLDRVLTNEEGMVCNFTHNAGLGESDHTCINFTLNFYHQVRNRVKVPNYFKANYAIIRQRLSQAKWTSVVHGDFITAYINFIKVLESALEGCVLDYKSEQKQKNIYLTPEAIRKKNVKNKLWRRYTRTRSTELRSLTRMLRFTFENNLAQSVKTSPKTFWSYVKSKTKTRSKIPPLKKTDGSEAKTAKENAETLNSFF